MLGAVTTTEQFLRERPPPLPPGRRLRRVGTGPTGAGTGACEANGTVTEPRTYHAYTLAPTTDVPSLVGAGVGMTGA